MEGDESNKGFQVRDRRRFTETGEVREEAEVAAERPETRPEQEKTRAAEGHTPEPAPISKEHEPQPEITLGTFLMSLSTQALMCLGEIPNPVTGETEVELTAVRELIDIISMLQEKTRGNVDAGEVRLFETILYDLRMRFVEKANSK